MADEIKGKYPSSLICSVNKAVGTSNYTVKLKVYNWSTLESEKEEEFTIEVGPIDGGVVGVYQVTYPDTYLTDTVVRGKPIDAFNLGLSNFFANCVSFTSLSVTDNNVGGIDENADVGVSYSAVGGFTNAFYKCTSLETVVFSSLRESGVLVPDADCSSMFEGCSSLTTITGTLDFSEADYTKCKDMFKGCASLTGLQIKNGTDSHDIMASLTVGSITYDHAYEYLGLSVDQFEIVTEGS